MDDSQPDLDATNLNNIETGVANAPYGADATANQVPVWSGTAWLYQGIKNAQVDAAAAIAYSKLALSGSVTNSDIAAAAAIAYTKLALTNSIVNADISSSAAIAFSKLADPGSGKVIGSAGSGAVAVVPPGTKLDAASITAAVTITATSEAAAQTVVDGNSVTYDGTEVRIEIFTPQILNTGGATGPATAVILRDTTVVGQVPLTQGLGASAAGDSASAVVYDTPAAGAHTYKWHLFGGGTSTWSVKADVGGSGKMPAATLRVTKA